MDRRRSVHGPELAHKVALKRRLTSRQPALAIILTERATPGPISTNHAALIAEFYTCFNERRFAEAAAIFAENALVEHSAVHRTMQGGDGYLTFAKMWCQGFPDATELVEE